MHQLAKIAREVVQLFVDDGALAVAVVAWLVLAWLVFPRLDIAAGVKPIVLFVGLVAILIESAWRGARK